MRLGWHGTAAALECVFVGFVRKVKFGPLSVAILPVAARDAAEDEPVLRRRMPSRLGVVDGGGEAWIDGAGSFVEMPSPPSSPLLCCVMRLIPAAVQC